VGVTGNAALYRPTGVGSSMHWQCIVSLCIILGLYRYLDDIKIDLHVYMYIPSNFIQVQGVTPVMDQLHFH